MILLELRYITGRPQLIRRLALLRLLDKKVVAAAKSPDDLVIMVYCDRRRERLIWWRPPRSEPTSRPEPTAVGCLALEVGEVIWADQSRAVVRKDANNLGASNWLFKAKRKSIKK